jgi:hypothetical protein
MALHESAGRATPQGTSHNHLVLRCTPQNYTFLQNPRPNEKEVHYSIENLFMGRRRQFDRFE